MSERKWQKAMTNPVVAGAKPHLVDMGMTLKHLPYNLKDKDIYVFEANGCEGRVAVKLEPGKVNT